MTDELYLEDQYMKEFDATVVKRVDNGVILDKTAFFPRMSGLEGDRGVLIAGVRRYPVSSVRVVDGDIVHIIEGELPGEGEAIHGVIDWENRYRQMRLHTAVHIFSAFMYELYGAEVSGGHINAEKARIQYTVDQLTPEMIEEVLKRSNEVVQKDLPVKVYWLPREEALKIPGIVKLAAKMPPTIERWRIVEIPGVDTQADGGVHVARTGEIGEIVFLKKENKGKGRKAVHITVKP